MTHPNRDNSTVLGVIGREDELSARAEKPFDFVGQMIQVLSLALPNNQNAPAHFLQGLLVPSVTANVAIQLLSPELAPGSGDPVCRAARVAMPETTVDEDYLAPRAEHQIGAAWKLLGMETVAVTYAVNEPPNDHLGPRVLGGNPAHQLAALLGSERIAPGPPF